MPLAAQQAFRYALDLLEEQLVAPVEIQVSIGWVDWGASEPIGGGSVSAWVTGINGPGGAATYPSALADQLLGYDILPGAPDMSLVFSNSSNWYFGTDATPPSGKTDFIGVALHELVHGLGFINGFRYKDGLGSIPGPSSNDGPSSYDMFVGNAANDRLVTAYSSPSRELGAALVSGNLYWLGANARRANGGNPLKLWAGTSWQGDTNSLAHLQGGAAQTPTLMTSDGPGTLRLDSIVRAMLVDMGYGFFDKEAMASRAYLAAVASD